MPVLAGAEDEQRQRGQHAVAPSGIYPEVLDGATATSADRGNARPRPTVT
jgi:hypothetical protein